MLRSEPWNTFLWSLDHLLRILVPLSIAEVPKSPRRILICNNAHLGDLINATAILAPLRKLFPDAQIGFLTSSWASPVIEKNPEVSFIHTFDHFLLNRSDLSLLRKIKQHITTARKAVHEIRKLRYEVGIDTYHFIQNSIPLLWLAQIPIRIAYSSGGFGPLLTHALSWVASDRHLIDYHLDLLRPFGLTDELKKCARPIVVLNREAEVDALPKDYIVFHPASGARIREWPLENWLLLACKLERAGWKIVFTGHGMREQKNAEVIRSACPGSIDLCGCLSWEQFVCVLQAARLLVGVESAAGHTAAAVSTPCVVIYSGVTNTSQMRPLGAAVRTVSHAVPCTPCFRTRGCSGMECVREVSVDRVFEACLESLRSYPKSCRKEMFTIGVQDLESQQQDGTALTTLEDRSSITTTAAKHDWKNSV